MWTWNEKLKLYIDERGKQVPLPEVLKLIERLEVMTKRQMKRIATQYTAKSSSLTEFEIQMATVLRQSHLLAAGVARGGKAYMTPKSWGTAGQKIKEQYQYLSRFERAIKNGKVSDAQLVYRAQLYASSIRTAYLQQSHDEQKQVDGQRKGRRLLNAAESCSGCIGEADREWIPIDEMTPIGAFSCGQFCLCELEYQ